MAYKVKRSSSSNEYYLKNLKLVAFSSKKFQIPDRIPKISGRNIPTHFFYHVSPELKQYPSKQLSFGQKLKFVPKEQKKLLPKLNLNKSVSIYQNITKNMRKKSKNFLSRRIKQFQTIQSSLKSIPANSQSSNDNQFNRILFKEQSNSNYSTRKVSFAFS